MLNLTISDFDVELKDGAIKNVGAPTKSGTAKLWDVESVELREYGDRRLKLICSDDDGNEVQVALFPEHIEGLTDDIEALRSESPVFE